MDEAPPEPNPSPPRWETPLALGVAALVALVYALILLGRGHPYDVDHVTQFLPYAQAFADARAAGEWPLWCGGIWGGYPLHAEGQGGFFSPLKLVWLFSDDALAALEAELVLSLMLAAACGALAGRLMGYAPPAAATCGVVWALGGAMLVYQENPAMLATHLVLPLAMALALRGRWRGLALALTFAILAGHPYGYALVIASSAVAWWLGPASHDDDGVRPPWRTRLKPLAAAVGLAMLVGAVQWIPTLELVLHSDRVGTGLSSQARTQGLVHFADLRHLLIPWPDARINFSPDRGVLAYVGLPAAFLVFIGLRSGWPERGVRVVGWVGGLALLLTVVASSLPDSLAEVPLLGLVRGPNKLLFLVTACVALAAGRGCTWVGRLKHPLAKVLPWVVLLVVALDLGYYGQRKAVVVEREALRSPPRIAESLPENARIRVLGTMTVWGNQLPRQVENRTAFLHEAQPMDANVGVSHGFEHAAGYTPLRVPRSLQYSERVSIKRLQRSSTSHVVLDPRIRPLKVLEPVARSRRWAVYKVPGSLPRAYLCPRAVVVDDPDEALARVDREPLDVVVLEGPEGRDAAATLESGTGSPGQVTIVERTPCRMVLELDLERPAVVVVPDTFYPGWEADLDGEQAPLLVANGAWKAVAVPAGKHEVTLSYEPGSFLLGACLSVLGILLCCGCWLWTRRRPGAPQGSESPPSG